MLNHEGFLNNRALGKFIFLQHSEQQILLPFRKKTKTIAKCGVEIQPDYLFMHKQYSYWSLQNI